MSKAQTLLAILPMLTGLTIDDIIKETVGTEEEKAKAQMDNIAKMADHMNGGRDEWKSHYTDLRDVPNHGLCGVSHFAFTAGLVTGLDEIGYEGRYCYEFHHEAVKALEAWDGTGDPSGPWIKYKGRGCERLGPGALDE